MKNFFLPVAKKIGRSLFSHGVGLAKDIAEDALAGKSIKSSLLDRGKSHALDFGKSAAKEGVSALSSMIGKGSRRAPRRRRRHRRAAKRLSRKRISRKPKSRKRSSRKTTSRKSISRKRKTQTTNTPKAKRRRTNF